MSQVGKSAREGECYNIFRNQPMLPLHEIETFLQPTPPSLQEIVLDLRNLIAEVAPDAVEVVSWGGLSYFHEGRGGIVSAGICQIGVHNNHIRLAFIHGAFLPDPRSLAMRHPSAQSGMTHPHR
jgi:hypothetical protein